MTKILRPYQQQAINECWEALKKNDEPVLLMASVGAGKSLMLASILLTMQNAGKRALCIVNNAELVRNNCETFIEQGGNASIYCAALGDKDCTAPIVFGTPQSILNGITKNEKISTLKFNIVVVDEAHAINYLNDRSVFMRILRYYKSEHRDMRLLGATGTDFRFNGRAIVGKSCLFRSQVGNITTERLIDEGYLVKPHFEIDKNLVIDFSGVKIKQNGLFDQKQLEQVVTENARLTELICKQVVHIMDSQNRFGCFFFATTKKHAYEILSHLPPEQSAIILGETPQHERTEILDKARTGAIKYLVNIAIISVGVDVPAYDTIAYLRPTESLVLLVQTMGRVLRLSPSTNKTEALVLDFAGNIERHRDWDNPLLLKAVQQVIDKDRPLVIQCPACQKYNTEYARRCVGITNEKRCGYFFEFKACAQCGAQNDIAARLCHACEHELIDPNAKLSMGNLKATVHEIEVIEAKFQIRGTRQRFGIMCIYICRDESSKQGTVYETFYPTSKKSKYVFYGQFIKKHCDNPHDWLPHVQNIEKMEAMLHTMKIPKKLHVAQTPRGIKIKKKIF